MPPVNDQKTCFLAPETGQELFSRLEWMTLAPQVIVEMGAGEMAEQLQARYQAAKLVNMADTASLAQHSVDLIFAILFFLRQKKINENKVD